LALRLGTLDAVEHLGPSTTAQRVAAHRLTFTRLASSSGQPLDDEALGRDVAGDTAVDEGRMHRYLASRTTFFDAVVVGALDAGVRQVVILGAGYDARSLRYARAGARFFEVDLAGTQLDKLERLTRLGAAITEVTYLAADFAADPVDERLVAAGHLATAPSLFVLEGVVPYLHRDVLASLCATVRRVAAQGSLFAISVGLERRADDGEAAARAAAFAARVGAMGEPVLTTLGPDDGADLLTQCGWEVRDDVIALRLDPGLDARRRSLGLLLARAAA
jgi:methyltransferase (TIGR00027 family)